MTLSRFQFQQLNLSSGEGSHLSTFKNFILPTLVYEEERKKNESSLVFDSQKGGWYFSIKPGSSLFSIQAIMHSDVVVLTIPEYMFSGLNVQRYFLNLSQN